MSEEIRINYEPFKLNKIDEDGNEYGMVVVLMYSGAGDPKIALDHAVNKITKKVKYFELIDAHLDNPWTRVILAGINNMKQEKLDFEKHDIYTMLKNVVNRK